MRKSDTASRASRRTTLAVSLAARHADEPTRLICLALVLAVVALALRIMAVW